MQTPRRRWLPWALAGAFGLAVIVHGAAWLLVTGRMLDSLPGAIAQAAAEGWTIQTGPPARIGWPLYAGLRLPGPIATREFGGTAVTLAADQVDLVLRPTHPTTLVIEPGRTAELRLGTDSKIPLHTDAAEIRVPLTGADPVTVSAQGLRAGDPAQAVEIGHLDARLAPGTLAGSAGPISLTPPLPAPFDTGATLTTRMQLSPPIPLAPTPAQSAAAWQSARGRLTTPELSLRWGPLQIDGTLTGGLDPALQPAGSANFRVTGATEVLDAAAKAGLLAPGPASAARAVLGLLTLAARGGPVTLPMTLSDRTLTVAQFALLRLPSLDWNAR